jgi:hypothetical protein
VRLREVLNNWQAAVARKKPEALLGDNFNRLNESHP